MPSQATTEETLKKVKVHVKFMQICNWIYEFIWVYLISRGVEQQLEQLAFLTLILLWSLGALLHTTTIVVVSRIRVNTKDRAKKMPLM